MNRWTNGLLALALMFPVAACQQQAAEEEGAAEETAAEETTTAAEIEATLDSLGNAFEAAVENNDPAAIAAQYTEDAVLLPPGEERIEGRQNIESSYAEWLNADTTASITLTIDRLEVAESGDLAYEIGTAQVSGTTREGEAYEDTGKYLVAWEKVDGEWLIAADSWSSDAPMPGVGEGEAGEAEAGGQTGGETEDEAGGTS
ncbi:MAG: SgcJ/EcaC family oxidoreductase [Gemmatimonadota bacterium]|nr:SgcJ/EcaC family oxidoreductase [Gemmatimonadota bacterium]